MDEIQQIPLLPNPWRTEPPQPPRYDEAISEIPKGTESANTPEANSPAKRLTKAEKFYNRIVKEAGVSPTPVLTVQGMHIGTVATEVYNSSRSSDWLICHDDGSREKKEWYAVKAWDESKGEYPDVEDRESATPGLRGWCDRFYKNWSPFKTFTIQRSIRGFDLQILRSFLIAQIRSLNYQGKISISLDLERDSVTIHSDHWMNRLRQTILVRCLCIIFQLRIITWPFIALFKRHYEVVRVDWYSSRYIKDNQHPSQSRKIYATGKDESMIAEYWAPIVRQATWEKLRGSKALDEGDMERLRYTEAGVHRATIEPWGGNI
ncbi:hypothetical protein MW887_005670 [Aspergillus wentii]|nr:hypothetical protein MW887_005670 [Aspergillus wentii]